MLPLVHAHNMWSERVWYGKEPTPLRGRSCASVQDYLLLVHVSYFNLARVFPALAALRSVYLCGCGCMRAERVRGRKDSSTVPCIISAYVLQ